MVLFLIQKLVNFDTGSISLLLRGFMEFYAFWNVGSTFRYVQVHRKPNSDVNGPQKIIFARLTQMLMKNLRTIETVV